MFKKTHTHYIYIYISAYLSAHRLFHLGFQRWHQMKNLNTGQEGGDFYGHTNPETGSCSEVCTQLHVWQQQESSRTVATMQVQFGK
jgi:hypothetical protein